MSRASGSVKKLLPVVMVITRRDKVHSDD